MYRNCQPTEVCVLIQELTKTLLKLQEFSAFLKFNKTPNKEVFFFTNDVYVKRSKAFKNVYVR